MPADNPSNRYDLIVIGSGPAGEKGASMAALFGKRVAMVERANYLGGASTNTGTIPSKTLRETALALSGFQARKLYGVDLSLRRQATVADFMYHEKRVKDHERQRIGDVIERGHIDLVRGVAEFVDPHTIRVTTEEHSEPTILQADYILIAAGSSPRHPTGFDFTDKRILDSDRILTMDRLPKTLAVVGAGVIGCEYACTFAALNCKVYVIDGRNALLPFLDSEVSSALAEAMTTLGIEFHWGETVSRCQGLDSGPVEILYNSGKSLLVDAVLVAAGRSSNTQKLHLEAAGVPAGPHGLIPVDEHYRTVVEHIYAAGDVIGFPAQASTSAEQARVAMCHAFDFRYKNALASVLPTGIYTIPEVSMVGETEDALKAKGVPYITGKADYMRNARGQIIGASSGFLKLLFEKETMKLLGAHAIGEQASEIIHIAMLALLTGGGADLFNVACFNYPTLGDLYKHATYTALQRCELERRAILGSPANAEQSQEAAD